MINGWIRPLRRELWHIIPGWRRAHHFMSNQALGVGTACLSVFIALDFSRAVILTTLYVTVAAVIYGSLVEQPELEDE